MPDKAPELKGCPFCGGDDLEESQTLLPPGKWHHTIECRCCTANGGFYSSPEQARTAWNTRATPPPVEQANVEQRARELLAAEFEAWGQEPPRSQEWIERANAAAKEVREQEWALVVGISTSDLTKIALRAIATALTMDRGVEEK